MKTRLEIRIELQASNPTTDVNGIIHVPGDTVYEELMECWIDAMQSQTLIAPPIIVPFRALAFALLEAGLYEQVKTAALATTEGEIWWNTAQSTTVQRDHPFVIALATAIGQTPEQIDAIFASALASQ
jgi:hypothetical protein